MLLTILLLILTTLKDGMFHTEYETEVAASSQECNMVIDSMIYQTVFFFLKEISQKSFIVGFHIIFQLFSIIFWLLDLNVSVLSWEGTTREPSFISLSLFSC